jgi:hypothetical protein
MSEYVGVGSVFVFGGFALIVLTIRYWRALAEIERLRGENAVYRGRLKELEGK